MSYYSHSNKFVISDHARERIKQRLKIRSDNVLEIDIQINEKLMGIIPEFSDYAHDYYKIPGTLDLYAIVVRSSNLIRTVTKIGPHKKTTLL